ncbi:MAG TPA: ferrochelatase, partial [Legionellaceae bacterium]|nr:ferrochelatase [Legionellaceae bacterium]
NLGTPDTPDLYGVANYLRQFLSDKRIIKLPTILRYLLVYGWILPFRLRKITHAYQSIWTKAGSPLKVHSEALAQKLQERVGANYRVVLSMRYGNPTIKEGLQQLTECDNLIILPLYPQYSSAATGSSLEAVLKHLATYPIFPSIHTIPVFYNHSAFIEALSQRIQPYLSQYEMIVFSYHGLPEQELVASGCQDICMHECPDVGVKHVPHCYRQQCYATSRLLAERLELSPHRYVTAYQSRLGRLPWVQPYLENVLQDLAQRGIKRIAVSCPSFVADCLETLEEIQIRAQHYWHHLGGDCLILIPCLNEEEYWCDALVKIVK